MAKKNKNEFTASQSQRTLTGLTESRANIDFLLGEKEITPSKKFLIQFKSNIIVKDLYKRLDKKSPEKKIESIGLIVGPFYLEEIQKLIRSHFIDAQDLLIDSLGRWRKASELVPELFMDLIVEETQAEYTVTLTETKEAKSPQLKKIKEPDSSPKKSEIDEKSDHPLKKEKTIPIHEHSFSSVEKEKKEIRVTQVKKTSTPQKNWKAKSLGALLLGLVAFLLLFPYFKKSDSIQDVVPLNAKKDLKIQKKIFPEELRPHSLKENLNLKSQLKKRLYHVKKNFNQKKLQLSEDSLRELAYLASPAISSDEVQSEAVNLLAFYDIQNNKIGVAKKRLQRHLQNNKATTELLLNLSLCFLKEGDYVQAREVALSAENLCSSSACSLSKIQLAHIESLSGGIDLAEKYFEEANSQGNYKLMIHGLIQNLYSSDGQLLAKRKESFLKALWSDFDEIKDSRVEFPIAAYFFYQESLKAWKTSLRDFSSLLTPAQNAFLNDLFSSFSLKNDFSITEESIALLKKERPLLSQVYYAYALKENKNYSESMKVLDSVLAQLNYADIQSVWPWVLAGDIEFYRGFIDSAALRYQFALNRLPRSVPSLHGIALILREKNDFNGVRQKFEEALSINNFFSPSILRVHRFDIR